MRAIVKPGPQPGYEYREDVVPRQLDAGEVRVRVAAASICGTDRHLVDYTPAAEAFDMTFPVVLGHEVAGTVVEVGAGVSSLRRGERVALESHIDCGACYHCRMGQGHNCLNMKLLGLHTDGGFADSVAVAARACYRLPDAVPLELGALLEPAGVAMHSIERSGHTLAGESVLIAGGGPIGLVLAQLARAMGARHVVVIEPNDYRRELAGQLGATTLRGTDGLAELGSLLVADRGGFDVAFDCAGAPTVLEALLGAMRRESTVVCVGLSSAPVPVDVTKHVIRQGIALKGSFGRSLWRTWDRLVAMVAAGSIDLGGLVSHRLPLRDFGTALTLLRGDACKLLLIPDEDGPTGPATASPIGRTRPG